MGLLGQGTPCQRPAPIAQLMLMLLVWDLATRTLLLVGECAATGGACLWEHSVRLNRFTVEALPIGAT